MYPLILVTCVLLIVFFLNYYRQSPTVEAFRSRNPMPTTSRSVELYNPTVYSGLFARKFEVPLAYTRTYVSFPLHNSLSITKTYLTKGSKYDMMTKNLITPLWNVPDIYPLQSRRRILI